MDEVIIPIVAIVFGCGIPISRIWATHRLQIKQLEIQGGLTQGASSNSEIGQMREELRQLKETALSYDLSFDTALQRMEQRVVGVERSVQAIQSQDVQRIGSGR